MSDVSKTEMRGLLVPSPLICYDTYDSASSSLTQAGPLPGIPVAQNTTDMVLEATGDQIAGTTYNIKCQEPGLPGSDGGKFIWKKGGDTADQWRGVGSIDSLGITGFEAINYTTTASAWTHGHIITLQNDTLCYIVMENQVNVVCFTKSRTATSWINSAVYTSPGGASSENKTTILQLPSGRLMVFFGTCNHVITFYSDDYGITWVTSTQVIDGVGFDLSATAPSSFSTKRFRATYNNGQILLVIHTTDQDSAENRDRLYQYASIDFGSTWDYISTTTGYVAAYVANTDADQNSRGFHELILIDGNIIVLYIKAQNTTSLGDAGLYMRILGNAYQNLQNTAEIPIWKSNTYSLANITVGRLDATTPFSATLDDEGTIYFIANNAANNNTLVAYSKNGVSTTTEDVSFVRTIDFDDSAKWVNNHTVTAQLGRLVLAHAMTSDTDNHDASAFVTYIGGYTSLQYHCTSGNTAMYIPFYKPEEVAATWTKDVDIGLPSATLANATLTVTTAGSLTRAQWHSTPALTTASIYADLKCVSDLAASGAWIAARLASGATSYGLKVLVNDHNIVVSDLFGATLQTITTASVIAAVATGIQLYITMNADDGRVFYRPANLSGGDSDADHLWTDLGTFAALANGGASTTNCYFAVENNAQILGNTVTAEWKTISVEGHTASMFTQTNPTNLFGRAFSVNPQYIDDGLRINAVDGPGLHADRWDITTRYTYGVENVFTEVSPSSRRGFRSTTNASIHDIIFDIDATLGEEHLPLGDTLGLMFQDINFKTVTLWGYDLGTAAYILLATLDTSLGQSGLSFSRVGSTIVSVAGTVASKWFKYNELVGSYVKLTNGGASVIRKITANTEGGWGTSPASVKGCRITIEGVLAGVDPAGGGAMTCDIWSKDSLVIINQPTSFSKYRIRLPVQSTYEGDFRIGNMMAGDVAYFGQQYSRGRAITTQQNTQLTTGINGSRRSQNIGPSRRVVEFAFIDGIDTKPLFGTAPSPDYITGYASSVPAASPADTPFKVQGIVDRLQGSNTPIVYIPNIPQEIAGSTFIGNSRDTFVYGRIMTDIRLESILGSENESEVFQVATLTIEEEI